MYRRIFFKFQEDKMLLLRPKQINIKGNGISNPNFHKENISLKCLLSNRYSHFERTRHLSGLLDNIISSLSHNILLEYSFIQ